MIVVIKETIIFPYRYILPLSKEGYDSDVSGTQDVLAYTIHEGEVIL